MIRWAVRGAVMVMAPASAVAMMLVAAPAAAETPRDILLRAAYQAVNKAQALALVEQGVRAADTILAHDPANREALLQRAVATGYRAKLMKSVADAKSARAQFEALAASNPSDPEPQLALAAWHLETIHQVGAFVGRTVLGAQRAKGIAALDRAVSLGARQALFPGYAAMLFSLDPAEQQSAARFAQAALTAQVTSPVDQVARNNARVLLATLKAGDPHAATNTAERLLPFGKLLH